MVESKQSLKKKDWTAVTGLEKSTIFAQLPHTSHHLKEEKDSSV